MIERMASEQSMALSIMQAAIEVAKAAVMGVRETETPVNTKGQVPAVTKTGGPVKEQPTFN